MPEEVVVPSEKVAEVRFWNGTAGSGVYATRFIKAGSVVYDLNRMPVCPENSKYNITQTGSRFFDTSNCDESCLNHSCDPNLTVNYDQWTFIAVRDIQPGDQLTFNYLTTEWSMAAPFECCCGSSACFGKIGGFKFLSLKQQLKLFQVISPYCKQMFMLNFFPRVVFCGPQSIPKLEQKA
eukprot:CAMPEP_0196652016 /NCGR_PEP_ID=MMETSP1086-20130531/1217_1 /TAXON_ID=77921 /ORGANISM="Cyanoptyche  gloeocystis , Strain SAG4.97" /LENGTH=179 /DNA_ID=CAMNT_0041982349 /DNA_START=119 /DNA_END=658 /DNA_ORIENTATION=+